MQKIFRGGGKGDFYVKTLSAGLVATILLIFVISFSNRVLLGEIFLYEVLPFYAMSHDAPRVAGVDLPECEPEPEPVDEHVHEPDDAHQPPAPAVALVGLGDVVIEYGTTNYYDLQAVLDTQMTSVLNAADIDALRNPDTLRTTMYSVERQGTGATMFVNEMFDVDAFMAHSMRVNPQSIANNEPVVLIFHTHSTEFFVDSYTGDKFSGIVGVGAYLAALLNDMGIPALHYTRRFDIIDGRSHISGAYERQEPYIRRILEQFPTIEIVIDMHRDGILAAIPRLVTEIYDRPTAQIMFVNGLSMRNVEGVATPLATLPNPNRHYNLAFSFQMQLAANQLYPGFTRRIYLNAFRFSTHFMPKSLLLEVGDQRSTFQEAINAMYPFANVLAQVILR